MKYFVQLINLLRQLVENIPKNFVRPNTFEKKNLTVLSKKLNGFCIF